MCFGMGVGAGQGSARAAAGLLGGLVNSDSQGGGEEGHLQEDGGHVGEGDGHLFGVLPVLGLG